MFIRTHGDDLVEITALRTRVRSFQDDISDYFTRVFFTTGVIDIIIGGRAKDRRLLRRPGGGFAFVRPFGGRSKSAPECSNAKRIFRPRRREQIESGNQARRVYIRIYRRKKKKNK